MRWSVRSGISRFSCIQNILLANVFIVYRTFRAIHAAPALLTKHHLVYFSDGGTMAIPIVTAVV